MWAQVAVQQLSHQLPSVPDSCVSWDVPEFGRPYFRTHVVHTVRIGYEYVFTPSKTVATKLFPR